MMVLNPVRIMRWVLRGLALVVLVIVVYLVVTLVQVYLTGREYDPHRAGAIVVMGAAQYDGVPSPALKARLDEALTLYRRHDAPLLVTTGSKQPGDRYTEAQSGARYLETMGVPPDAVVQAGGNDSWQNLSDAAALLHLRGMHTALIVTDPFHEDRSLAIATDVGLSPSPTPTHSSPITGWSTVPYYAKETIGVAVGRIIGYQYLHAFG
jgi:uncharacterized SAM-binding protein YcdF (DUF218 family)